HVRTCRVVYDLWEEAFRVQRQTELEDRTFRLRTVEEVLDRCLVLRRTPIGTPLDHVAARGRPMRLAVVAEFNPLSAKTVQRIRHWLSRPSGTTLERDAFLGSFVSLFVSQRISQAERTVRFGSQETVVPDPGRR